MARNLRRFYQMFHVEADPMEYYYMLLEKMPDPMNGIIGYIYNDTNEKVRIALEVDNEYMKSRDAMAPLLYVDPEDYIGQCRIVMDAAMAKKLVKQNPEVVFSLWHELGHFHTMEKYLPDYMTYEMDPSKGYTADQYLAMVNGEVLEYDASADDFALAYVGLDNCIISMNGKISLMKMKNSEEAAVRGAIKSILNRKQRFLGMKKQEGEKDE